MATQTINLPEYTLYPSPRNEHRMIFEFQLFVPYPYELIHLPDYNFKGKAALFAAHRKHDNKSGQLITCELAEDLARFERLFEPV
ncbi:hypothetical protein GCM10010975_18300 [Comamonas phosphati]|nr:hypothetical protein GCM10010975_18300 [Comamonas phosphati]